MIRMEPVKKHQLTILFDQNQTNISQLWELARKTVSIDVSVRVGLSENNDLILSIEGSLEAVDKSHIQIAKYLIDKMQWNFFRLRDTAGDEIRDRAYPILSIIEQELRSFLNRCLIDAFGFCWWASLGELTLPGNSASFRQGDHHPLERMTIEQII